MPLPHVRLARVLCLAFRSPLRSVRCTTSCGAIPHCSPQCVCHADEPRHALRRLAPRLVAVRMQPRLRPQRRRALAQLAAGGRVAVNRQRLRVGEDVGVRDREVHRWRAQLPLFGVQVRMRSHTRRRAAVNDSEIYRSLKHSKRDQCAGEPPSAVPPSAVRPSAGPASCGPAPCGPAPCRAHSRASASCARGGGAARRCSPAAAVLSEQPARDCLSHIPRHTSRTAPSRPQPWPTCEGRGSAAKPTRRRGAQAQTGAHGRERRRGREGCRATVRGAGSA